MHAIVKISTNFNSAYALFVYVVAIVHGFLLFKLHPVAILISF